MILLLSSSVTLSSAADTQVTSTGKNFIAEYDGSFGVNVLMPTDYFRAVENNYNTSGWSILRSETFNYVYDLVNRHNNYIKPLNNTKSVMEMTVYLSSDKVNEDDESNAKKAKKLSKRWVSLQKTIYSIIRETNICCYYDSPTPKYEDGRVVVASNYKSILTDARSANSVMEELIEDYRTAYDQANYSVDKQSGKKVSALMNVVNKLWTYLGSTLKTWGTNSSNTSFDSNFFGMTWTTSSMASVANAVSAVTKSFAYCLLVVLFGLNMTDMALKFDMVSVEGAVRVIGGLLLGKVWVDVSINVCRYILDIINSMNLQLFKRLSADADGTLKLLHTINVNQEADNSWFDFFGAIINWFAGMFWIIPELILCGFLIFAILSVFIKIVTRSFELTCLMCLSPLFFACIANEETKQYFRRFISAFLGTALYMTFMVITYIVGTQWLSEVNSIDTGKDLSSFLWGFLSLLPRFVIIFGICRIMRKPPKVLTGLID